jgi:hypothetical protein
VDATALKLDHEQDVEALEEDGVDGEEVALEDARRLPMQKLLPTGFESAWRRLDPFASQDDDADTSIGAPPAHDASAAASPASPRTLARHFAGVRGSTSPARPGQPARAADEQPDAQANAAAGARRGSRSPWCAPSAPGAQAAQAHAARPSRPATQRPAATPAPRPLTLQAKPLKPHTHRESPPIRPIRVSGTLTRFRADGRPRIDYATRERLGSPRVASETEFPHPTRHAAADRP